MTPRSFLAPVLLVPALLAMESHAEAPVFAPEAGSELTKRFETTVDISLTDSQMIMNGQDVSADMAMESETHIDSVAEFTDTYVAVADGRATTLMRTFDELSSETKASQSNAMGSNDSEMSGSSDLEGETVVFTWDEDAEEYGIAFDEDSSGDDELLEDLVAAADMTAFLPDGEVAEGDTWDVEPRAILEFIAPGGSLKIVDEGAEAQAGPSSANDLLEDFDGEIIATFAGIREEDGARLAVIELAIDVSSAVDMTEMIMDAIANNENMPAGVEVDVESADMEFLFEGEGEVLWNLSRGVVYSARISGDVEQVVDQAMNLSFSGQEQATESSSTNRGTQTVTLTTK